MAIEFTPGAVFKVPVGGSDFAYAVMHFSSPYIAFYHQRTVFDESGVPSEPPMFTVLVAHAAYKRGRWGKPIRHLPVEALGRLPRFFHQAPTNRWDCKIVDPNERTRLTAEPEDCVGLESEGIWGAEHVESRIVDTYAGRSNIWDESMRVKL